MSLIQPRIGTQMREVNRNLALCVAAETALYTFALPVPPNVRAQNPPRAVRRKRDKIGRLRRAGSPQRKTAMDTSPDIATSAECSPGQSQERRCPACGDHQGGEHRRCWTPGSATPTHGGPALRVRSDYSVQVASDTVPT